MQKIVDFTRRYKIIGSIVEKLLFILFEMISLYQGITGLIRSKTEFGFEKSKIRKLKNKYFGKRCFIICTGPSLLIEDLDNLSTEYTFAMNSISLLYDKTDFRPSFYGCIDEGVYKKFESDILKYDAAETLVFISNRIRKYCANVLPKNWFNVSCNVAYHTYDRWFKNKFWCKFSRDAVYGTYDMYSVTHFLIQIAVYMGFKEIYLVGCDCNQSVGKKVHFQDYGVVDTTLDTARERNICGFEEIKREMTISDFKVYNATRGGELEVFDRIDLDEVLHNGSD